MYGVSLSPAVENNFGIFWLVLSLFDSGKQMLWYCSVEQHAILHDKVSEQITLDNLLG